MKSMVETVKGSISLDELGFTLMHEHLYLGDWNHRMSDPEWFDYEGEPFHFKVSTTEILSGEKNETFTKLIKSMKNARSHLDLITTERTTESTIYLAAGETSHTIAPVIIAN